VESARVYEHAQVQLYRACRCRHSIPCPLFRDCDGHKVWEAVQDARLVIFPARRGQITQRPCCAARFPASTAMARALTRRGPSLRRRRPVVRWTRPALRGEPPRLAPTVQRAPARPALGVAPRATLDREATNTRKGGGGRAPELSRHPGLPQDEGAASWPERRSGRPPTLPLDTRLYSHQTCQTQRTVAHVQHVPRQSRRTDFSGRPVTRGAAL
jgi:hypothetical protein